MRRQALPRRALTIDDLRATPKPEEDEVFPFVRTPFVLIQPHRDVRFSIDNVQDANVRGVLFKSRGRLLDGVPIFGVARCTSKHVTGISEWLTQKHSRIR